jgi:hypothetical protein
MDKDKNMRKMAFLSCLVLASAAFTSAAIANRVQHYKYARHGTVSTRNHVPAPEILTTVGTPDCHLQGRLLRAAHHCPPEAVAAAPR